VGVGDIAIIRGDRDNARVNYEKAVPLFQQIGSVRGEANCRRRLGELACEQGEIQVARTSFLRAVALYERISDMPTSSKVREQLVQLEQVLPLSEIA
jgi:Tetratricopeptide repeat